MLRYHQAKRDEALLALYRSRRRMAIVEATCIGIAGSLMLAALIYAIAFTGYGPLL
jgi:hypothetical protein